ncbi:hypothetical protein AAY473_009307 [Plecturocebus cupreus]
MPLHSSLGNKRQGLALLPMLECSGTITTHCSLNLLAMSNPPAGWDHRQVPPHLANFCNLLFCRDKTGFLHVDQAGLKLLNSGDSLTSASQSAEITSLLILAIKRIGNWPGQWLTPVIPALWEAKAGRSPEHSGKPRRVDHEIRRWRPSWLTRFSRPSPCRSPNTLSKHNSREQSPHRRSVTTWGPSSNPFPLRDKPTSFTLSPNSESHTPFYSENLETRHHHQHPAPKHLTDPAPQLFPQTSASGAGLSQLPWVFTESLVGAESRVFRRSRGQHQTNHAGQEQERLPHVPGLATGSTFLGSLRLTGVRKTAHIWGGGDPPGPARPLKPLFPPAPPTGKTLQPGSTPPEVQVAFPEPGSARFRPPQSSAPPTAGSRLPGCMLGGFPCPPATWPWPRASGLPQDSTPPVASSWGSPGAFLDADVDVPTPPSPAWPLSSGDHGVGRRELASRPSEARLATSFVLVPRLVRIPAVHFIKGAVKSGLWPSDRPRADEEAQLAGCRWFSARCAQVGGRGNESSHRVPDGRRLSPGRRPPPGPRAWPRKPAPLASSCETSLPGAAQASVATKKALGD